MIKYTATFLLLVLIVWAFVFVTGVQPAQTPQKITIFPRLIRVPGKYVITVDPKVIPAGLKTAVFFVDRLGPSNPAISARIRMQIQYIEGPLGCGVKITAGVIPAKSSTPFGCVPVASKGFTFVNGIGGEVEIVGGSMDFGIILELR